MQTIALTGGIASGKTAASDYFAELGAPVIDSDVIAREVVTPHTDGWRQVVAAFGPGVVTENGELDREYLRRRVFSDPGQRRRLESIIHPLVKAGIQRRLDALGPVPYAIVVVPLLVETGMQDDFDRVLVIDVPEEIQIQRLMRRDGTDDALARRMLVAQASRRQRLAFATEVISNDGDRASLKAQVRKLHQAYSQSTGAPS